MTRADLHHLTGKGVRIAVLDSGIDTTHPALDGLKLADDIAFERDGPFLKAVDTSGDVIGHGTAIAWIIRSMVPDAEIGSFRVLDADLAPLLGGKLGEQAAFPGEIENPGEEPTGERQKRMFRAKEHPQVIPVHGAILHHGSHAFKNVSRREAPRDGL
jgi:subtilisin family serine protease